MKWINVKEMLPECDDYCSDLVLIYTDKHYMCTAKYFPIDTKWLSNGSCCNELEGVTHWMLLPTVPKIEKIYQSESSKREETNECPCFKDLDLPCCHCGHS